MASTSFLSVNAVTGQKMKVRQSSMPKGNLREGVGIVLLLIGSDWKVTYCVIKN